MEAMKRLSSMPAFHHHHQNGGGGAAEGQRGRKKAAMDSSPRRHHRDEHSEEDERDRDRSASEEEEDAGEERTKKLSRSKSFKMKLLQKIGRGSKEDKKGTSKEQLTRNKMEKRKDEMIKSYDKKAQLDSSSSRTAASSSHHNKEFPSAAMCMNLPGYKSHIKRSASSSSSPGAASTSAMNNRGRQAADRQAQANSSGMLLFEEGGSKETRRGADASKDRHHHRGGELRLGDVFSPTATTAASKTNGRAPSPSSAAAASSSTSSSTWTSSATPKSKQKESEGDLGKREKSHHRASFLPGVSARHHHNQRPVSTAAPGAAAQDASATVASPVAGSSRASGNFDSGEGEYVERGEEGIDLMELQRQFQQVGAVGAGAGGAGGDERRARAAEDRVKGGARLPWWGLNASSGKEGRRKEWERFFSGFKVSELWEDDEGEDEDEDEEDDVDGCGGKKVPYLTEETTVKEALDVMSERALNALPICLKEVDSSEGEKTKAKAADSDGSQEDEVRERALRHLRKWRKAELVRERERKQRKQRGKTVLGWIDLRDLLTFAVFKFPRPPSADTGIDEVRRQGIEFTQHKIRELVNIYGMNGAHVVNEEGTGGQGRHRIAANDRMPAVFRMLRSEKGLRVLPVYDQSQLPAESRCLVRVLDTNAVVKWLHRIVQDNRLRSPFVRELANRQVRHWGAFADAILGKELIYFETEEMINNFDHFRASKRERRMSKLIVPFGSADGGSTVEVISKKTNGKTPSPPPTPNDHSKEKIDLNKHLFTISADRSVIDAFKILYNYKVSALGVLEKKGKERDVDDQSSSEEEDSEEESESSSSDSEEEHVKATNKKKKRDQEKARGPSLKEAKAMVEAARDSSSDESSDSESESDDSASDTEPGDRTTATTNVVERPKHRANSPQTVDLEAGAHTKPMRSRSDPLGLSASKRANAHDASDMTKSKSGSKEWRDPSGSRGKRTPTRGITREEMVVRAAQAGKLISHLSSSDLKHFEPYAMMRCLHMSIKEYLGCFKEKKPLVTCRRDTTLLQILEKMAREEVNRVWLLADEEDEDEEDAASGHDRKAKQQQPKPKDNGGRPIGMISLADVITEVTRL